MSHILKHTVFLCTSHDQGLVLDCSGLQWSALDVFPSAKDASVSQADAPPPVWIALDEVQRRALGITMNAIIFISSLLDSLFLLICSVNQVMDPQNFGAIVRSAHCLGVSGILACSRNCAPLSAAVSRASAGVLEVLCDEPLQRFQLGFKLRHVP